MNGYEERIKANQIKSEGNSNKEYGWKDGEWGMNGKGDQRSESTRR
jgi:hypothetical protein